MEHPFRSAAIGGFNKQDVLDFLETQAKQSAQAQQELQSRLEEALREAEDLRQERDGLERQLEKARQELRAADEERVGLSGRLEKASREASAGQLQVSQLTGELARVCQERDEMRTRLDAALVDAQAYKELKELTAGVELEAHRRAQSIQSKAEEDAQKARRQVEQWLQRVVREYDALCSQVEATVSHAASELEKVGVGLEQITGLMDSQGDALRDVRHAYNATDPGRVEAPMPIEEE